MIEKPKVLKCTLKVLENRSTFEMYLSTSTSTEDFPEMYLSTFQVLYKLYLSTDVLKYKVLLPGSGPYYVYSYFLPIYFTFFYLFSRHDLGLFQVLVESGLGTLLY